MECTTDAVDQCFLASTNDRATRHHLCVKNPKSSVYNCQEFIHKKPDTIVFTGLSTFSNDEKLVMEDLETYMNNMCMLLYNEWINKTKTRTKREEVQVPLSSLVIILINRCAVNLIGFMYTKTNFKLQPIFISVFIGWFLHWKKKFQDKQSKRSQHYLRSPWLAINYDLYNVMKRIVKLASLMRFVPNNIEYLETVRYIEEDGEWTCTKGKERSDPIVHTKVQQTIDVFVRITSSGRVHENGDVIVGDYTIPAYSTDYGLLYAYFKNVDRKMMCMASSILTSSMLNFSLTEETFGTHSYPGHIYTVYIKNQKFHKIETTLLNEGGFTSVGNRYNYILGPGEPIHTKTYAYIPNDNVQWTVNGAISSIAKVVFGIGDKSDIFPSSDRTERPYVIPIQQLIPDYRKGTLTFEFNPAASEKEMKTFNWNFIHKYMATKFNLVPNEYHNFKRAKSNVYYDKHSSVTAYRIDILFEKDIKRIIITLNDHEDLRVVYMAYNDMLPAMMQPSVIYIGTKVYPDAGNTIDVTTETLHNFILDIIGPNIDGHVVILTDKNTHNTDLRHIGSFIQGELTDCKFDGQSKYSIRHGTKNITQLKLNIERLNTKLLRSNVTYEPLIETESSTIGWKAENGKNIIYDKYQVSDLIRYDWYALFLTIGMRNNNLNSLLSQFATDAITCTNCEGKRIMKAHDIVNNFHYLKTIKQSNKRPLE
jgi:hypothetical protein